MHGNGRNGELWYTRRCTKLRSQINKTKLKPWRVSSASVPLWNKNQVIWYCKNQGEIRMRVSLICLWFPCRLWLVLSFFYNCMLGSCTASRQRSSRQLFHCGKISSPAVTFPPLCHWQNLRFLPPPTASVSFTIVLSGFPLS